ncbi:hypothetical protein KFL_004900050 [Klebsormidium nitens]|uniref:Uncharacterized protein n=1 Tax=Klebsormidium nitens TaxID=105231 RepID=A0A1Y1IM00_KLENI|nr:hypothetical protein KFL_004900050 [Klebsormidium nitens]|eukprot:GAQ89138.1 hypothetical protein KFL_004900050 [Klebsormidium nitens]
MASSGARNTTIQASNDCVANAILTILDQEREIKDPFMVVTYDNSAGLTRAAVYTSPFSVLVQDFRGTPDQQDVREGVHLLKDSVMTNLQVTKVPDLRFRRAQTGGGRASVLWRVRVPRLVEAAPVGEEGLVEAAEVVAAVAWPWAEAY